MAYSTVAILGAGMTFDAAATDVSLVGLLPGKALVVIDGGKPRSLAVGAATTDGVKLLSLEEGAAQFEIDGHRRRLVIGQHAVSTGSDSSRPASAILNADIRGQFLAQGSVNGAAMRFLVDTGASYVAMGAADAVRAGIDYRGKGQPGRVVTANGVVQAWKVPGNTVRLGDIMLHEVDVTVSEAGMPFALLGMSFLNRVEMTRDGSKMTLKKRY
ncbi:MAG: TIGR02281 family clan AA aspartic protease [Candidatus Nitricoxidivorans perseverans]|uniref:TIGR02281 family clan AA aspartic protease n=1 Tax=Candidatus Nitricoxidivorans perseverans TaxID=2975601 RepID=A0AA49FMV9_9PROT|nr:MAG: TIGR02281 family clan AA aspartic protease [Candidatus Nitricoxidivorans perseverans]